MVTCAFLSPTGLASIMKKLLIKYDNLFECSFPYSMGWHGEKLEESWELQFIKKNTFPLYQQNHNIM